MSCYYQFAPWVGRDERWRREWRAPMRTKRNGKHKTDHSHRPPLRQQLSALSRRRSGRVRGWTSRYPWARRRGAVRMAAPGEPYVAPAPNFTALTKEDPPYDIGEQAFSTFVQAVDQGRDVAGIPVFPSGSFRTCSFASVWIPPSGRNVTWKGSVSYPRTSPSTLEYGFASYLEHQYGVDTRKIIWVTQRDEYFGVQPLQAAPVQAMAVCAVAPVRVASVRALHEYWVCRHPAQGLFFCPKQSIPPRRRLCMIPVLCFVGRSGSGKTTLLERLLPEPKGRGHRVACLKDTHHSVDLDTPGTDTNRLRRALAATVGLVADTHQTLIGEWCEADAHTQAALSLSSRYDLLLAEGFPHDLGVRVCRNARAGGCDGLLWKDPLVVRSVNRLIGRAGMFWAEVRQAPRHF